MAARAGDAAEAAGLEHRLGHLAGLLHDLGKYSDEFQEHPSRRDRDRVEHACHGAVIAVEAGALDIAFAVAARDGLATAKGVDMDGTWVSHCGRREHLFAGRIR